VLEIILVEDWHVVVVGEGNGNMRDERFSDATSLDYQGRQVVVDGKGKCYSRHNYPIKVDLTKEQDLRKIWPVTTGLTTAARQTVLLIVLVLLSKPLMAQGRHHGDVFLCGEP
jgi:hypothetical protein